MRTDGGTDGPRGDEVHPLLRHAVAGATGSPLAYLAGGVYQVAFVTPDLHGLLRTFERDLGTARFMVLPDAQVTDQTYRGQPAQGRQDLAFGYAGTMQIEVIQPLDGTNSYTEFLRGQPAGGHHLGVLVEDYDTAVRDMERSGNPVVQTGRVGETRFAYVDTVAKLGVLLEVFRLAPDFVELFERIRRQDF